MNKAFKIIEDNIEEADFLGSVEENEIIEAENRLKLQFPESYKQFIKHYGLGDIFGEEIYGLGVEPLGIPSVIWITELLRKEMELPKDYLVIYNSGVNNEYHAIDCNPNENFGSVISFTEGISFKEQEINMEFSSFGEFFLKLLENNN
ncbi:hypothetical protein GS18_0218470 [Metabacillus indicus]|uniref:Knr4/Smi1-like domain-containing protein n=1 Tax=Metabacillus indicus TaxID=246786 RepID=A0A084GKV2_METID|nr:hypothetical protein GS18_0218470 [Metabacillus indicus]